MHEATVNPSFRVRISISAFCAFGAAACSNHRGPDYETDATLAVKDYVGGELQKLSTAAVALQRAAPAPDEDGWNPQDDAEAVDKMKAAWGDARNAYERIEGSIASLFSNLDVSTDQRYDYFVEMGPDDDLFDDEGVTGMHAIERILYSDSIPDRVLKFERALPNYVPAAFPSNHDQADEFKNKLCARLVRETAQMRDEYASTALDSAAAFRGMIGSMREQSEKTSAAATGEEESRYSQNTLSDMRANLDGARAVFKAFRSWSDAANGSAVSDRIQDGLNTIGDAYGAVDGPALPEVPAGFNPDHPTDDDLATPYGKLWKLLNEQTDPKDDSSLVSVMLKAADAMGIQEQ